MLFITNQLPNFVGGGSLNLQPVDPRRVMEALQSGFISLVNDQETANCLSSLLGVTVPQKQIEIYPKVGEDTVIVVNIIGGVLPKGTKVLPPTHTVQFSVIDSRKPMVDIKGIKKGIAEWLLKDM